MTSFPAVSKNCVGFVSEAFFHVPVIVRPLVLIQAVPLPTTVASRRILAGWPSLSGPNDIRMTTTFAGAIRVRCTDVRGTPAVAELAGRKSVFAGATDVAYLPRGSELVLEADVDCRVAVCLAVVADRTSLSTLPFRHIGADEVPVELRGAGQASREVRNFGGPGVLDAESIIACEVITPAGNWSSYPPHKHDAYREGVETELEEIYYFEVGVEAGAPAGSQTPDPVAYQRVYGSGEREIDVLAEVRSGDVVLVPYGWHGPATA